MKKYLYLPLLIISCFSGIESYAQSLPVDMQILNEYYRRAQLLGEIDPTISFTNRPLFPLLSIGNNIFDPDSTLKFERKSNFNGYFEFWKKKGIIQLLPISLLNQFNSHHPEGINDGSMIPAKGFQTKFSVGIFFKYGPLNIQLRPEFVYAQNKEFDGFPKNYTTTLGIEFPDSPYKNRIDFPERFGNSEFSNASWGQSSIRLIFGSISFGLSNENLWWGPGYRNSLLMTNSSPGFMHLTLNTVRPIKTFIGSFEGQIIAGKLEESGYTKNLEDDWRYINAIVFNYQPKWIPSLFLGVTRSFIVYRGDMGTSLGDYLPVFIPLSKSTGGTNQEVNNKRRNQLISVFMRWLFKKSNGEIYIEYGREDHSWDTRDFILEPSHSSAYILGLRKLFSLNENNKTYIQLILEITNLAGNKTTINREVPSTIASITWYQHNQVRHGYTHFGQILGAGIGPGSNLQTLEVSWVRRIKQIGFRLERYVHNSDFWYSYIKDFRSNWVDISYTAFANWDYKNFLVSLKLKYVKSRNYQWLYEPQIDNENPKYWMPGDNTLNFHGQIGITYRF
jgi:hypothetical protein